MSKNLTRKGLALGALVALGSSVIAGSPASAAPTALYLESAFGTSYEGVLGQNFVLSGTAAGAASGDDVSYYIEGVTAANLTVVGRYTTNLSTTTVGNAYSNPADADGEGIERVAAPAGAIYLANTDADAKVATLDVDTWSAGSSLELALKVNATNVTATTSVKVTPFLDNVNNDGVPGTNEYKGTPVTINFNKASELTATPTLAVKMGSAVKATVAVSKVNLEQFRATTKGAPEEQTFVNVDFKENGATAWTTQSVYPLYDTTDKVFTVSTGSNPTAGSVYGATAQFGTTDSASAALVTAGAGEVLSLSALAAAKGTSYKSGDKIRSGAGSVSISTTVTPVTGKSKAGQKVTFTIAETGISTLDSAATVTAGGKTLKNAASITLESVDVEVVSDADGKATLAIAYAGIKSANDFVVTAVASGASAPVPASSITLTGEDSAAVAVLDLSAVSESTSIRRVAKGSAMSIEYTIVDQFGQTPAGDFQAVITENSSSANFTANVAFSGGKGTFSGSDNSTSDNNYTVTATLYKKNATTGEWDSPILDTTSAVQIGAVATPASITASADNDGSVTPVDRDAITFVAGNDVLVQESVELSSPTNGARIQGTVIGSNGAAIAGATVTVTAPNLFFWIGSTKTIGSLTLRTDANGAYDVYVYSNKAGKQTVTIASGSVSKTQDITFAASTVSGANTLGAVWSTDAPTRILPGKTLTVTATLTDKFGNVVDTSGSLVKVSYTGPGFLTATPLLDTDSSGKVSFTVLLGAADEGAATVKFTFAGANGTVAEPSSNDDVVSTSTVVIGAAPVVVPTARIAGSTKRFFVSVDNNTGAKNVVIKVAGKTFKTLKGSSAMKSYAVAAPKGTHKVTVYVGGKLIATKTISVK